MNILVADDNEDSRKLLVKQLCAFGHNLTSARNGNEALTAALESPPDLMVTDILTPEMDGFQLCMEWRLNDKLKGIPVVFYTATYSSDEDEEFARSIGADAFVHKPAAMQDFMLTLSEVVEKAASGGAPPSPFIAPEDSGPLMGHCNRLLSKLCTKVAELKSDIADRRKVEQELHLKAQLLDVATDSIYVTDMNWTLLYVNQATWLRLGSGTEGVLGHDLREFIAPEYIEPLNASSAQTESTLEASFVRKDGAVAPVEIHHRIIDWDGRTVRLAVVRDINERRKAQEQQQETNARLERVLQGTLAVIEQMVEVRDPYTSGHQRRVAELAVALARKMRLPEESCVSPIRTAAIIHDLGKTTVPAEILSRPGRLSSAEFALIKCHAQVGYDIIKRANLPDPVADVVLQHHERLDGSGYPRGLSGDEILPEAQILAVADVVEAMSSHRPYRPALGIEAALEEISAGSGTRYYPDVVAACLSLFREQGFTLSD